MVAAPLLDSSSGWACTAINLSWSTSLSNGSNGDLPRLTPAGPRGERLPEKLLVPTHPFGGATFPVPEQLARCSHLTRTLWSPTLVSLKEITPEDRPWSRGLQDLRST